MPIDFNARPNVSALAAAGFPCRIHFGDRAWRPYSRGASICRRAARVIGVVLVVGGLALYGWGATTMIRAKTNMMPNCAADRLVDWGAFAVSRHPIYVGGAIAFLGLGVAANDGWICLAALIVALAIDRFRDGARGGALGRALRRRMAALRRAHPALAGARVAPLRARTRRGLGVDLRPPRRHANGDGGEGCRIVTGAAHDFWAALSARIQPPLQRKDAGDRRGRPSGRKPSSSAPRSSTRSDGSASSSPSSATRSLYGLLARIAGGFTQPSS